VREHPLAGDGVLATDKTWPRADAAAQMRDAYLAEARILIHSIHAISNARRESYAAPLEYVKAKLGSIRPPVAN
jgi:hypothetical protein